MTIHTDDLINSIIDSLDRISLIKSEEIPNIDLYMDQVTTFMDSHLHSTTRNPGEDKILTKTMINNYTKNDLLPPPVKKKYTKEHFLLLVLIYYFKGILSFSDIQTILKPITEKYFESDASFNIESVYREVLHFEEAQKEAIKQDIKEKFEKAEELFGDAPKEDEEFFKMFAFVSLLGFDVYVKKLLIEKLIDGYRADLEHEKEKEAPKSKKEK